MKLAGVILVFFSAGCGYFLHRRTAAQKECLLRELMDDLQLLRCRICVQRASLPTIITNDLTHGISGRYLWMPLAERLTRAEGTFCVCWNRSMDELPQEIAQRLAPLGELLPVGGETLARSIDELQREFVLLANEQRRENAVSSRLSAAMCFSAAALFILIFL